ncbi:MAG TPA: MFS transporter [Pirellulaceae bacterium]|nr:MFS transporter [Pirellulaceae bacterium]
MTEVKRQDEWMPNPGRETTGLVLLFGAMYFVQGIAEPTEGLIAQPVRSLLKSWGYSAAGIAGFGALLALPWSLKPLYGLLTDFVPIARTRRRSYLLLTSAASVFGLACLYFLPVPPEAYRQLLLLLLIPTVGVAFSDVVVDALMIEKGQPRGLTGMLQSVQWAAMYGGSILAGLVGGYLSQHGQQQEGFLLCAVTSFATLLLAWFYVREEPQQAQPARLRFAMRELAGAARTPAVLASGAFLFLWSFNPFSMSVLYMYMTQQLGISEQFYGVTVSLLSVGAIAGSLAYGAYCRRVRMSRLIHLAIATGVLSTLAYCCVTGRLSAGVISVVVGFSYMTGSMVQFDLAARACPVAAAGTTFAMLMALSNLSLSLSTALGGWLYDDWTARWGATTAFNLLVAAGALSTCACWLLVPLLNSAIDTRSTMPVAANQSNR